MDFRVDGSLNIRERSLPRVGLTEGRADAIASQSSIFY